MLNIDLIKATKFFQPFYISSRVQGEFNMHPIAFSSASIPSSSVNRSSKATRLQFGSRADKEDRLEKSTPFSGNKFKAGMRNAIAHAFNKSAILHDILWSGILSVLTCWMPGSQLILVPILMGTSMLYRAVTGFVSGSQQAMNEQKDTLADQAHHPAHPEK